MANLCCVCGENKDSDYVCKDCMAKVIIPYAIKRFIERITEGKFKAENIKIEVHIP